MKGIIKALIAAVAVSTALGISPAMAADGQAKPAKHRMVMQVSDADPARWNLALNNVRNVQAELGKENVEVEIVAYGPGIAMLKLDSVAGSRVDEAVKNGVRVVACENTMHNQKLSKADMLPSIGYVRAGVVELMERQRDGYAYIRP
jgi:intracellular sulfur oxidation DsrE/DsrF family protein